ncbi:MAG: hypothetical protein ACK5MQ_17020 [Pikeienuella sp.]
MKAQGASNLACAHRLQDIIRESRCGGSALSDRVTKREQQNQWIKARHRLWRERWHDAFDKDATLEAAGEFERPEELPAKMDTDHRLIFGLSQAEAATMAACFACFPAGAEMQRRFEAYLAGPPPAMEETEARRLVAELSKLADKVQFDDDISWTPVTVIDRKDPEARALISRSCRIAQLISKNLLDPAPEENLPTVAARLFLTEPLYAAAGNYYELCEWVAAAMPGASHTELHDLIYRLWNAGWRLRVSDDGVILLRD